MGERTVRTLIVVPAWNEEEALPAVLAEIAREVPSAAVLVVNDGSTDRTAEVVAATGTRLLDLPFNLGVGGAMRAGFKYALRHGYDIVVQLDANGQHNPADVPALLSMIATTGADIVIGARFAETGSYDVSGPRRWAMQVLSWVISRIAHARLTDTTSGFKAHGVRAIRLFAADYPAEYLGDTVEALVIAARAGLIVGQTGVSMRARAGGRASHGSFKAAVVHGELVGTVFDPTHPGWGHVTVPSVVAFTTQMPNCFRFKANVTASCIPSLPANAPPTEQAVSTASTYNPTYYALAGLPSLAPDGEFTLYMMRFVSAALCALALAWAFTQARTTAGGSWVSLGILLALTPMVVYLSSAINPASLEIAGAVALWVSLSAIIRDDDPTRVRTRIIGIAVIASIFVNLRGLSPFLLAVIVLSTVLSSPWRQTKRIIVQRATWPWIGLVALSTVAALAWIRSAGTLDSDGLVHFPTLDFWTAAQWSLGDTSVYLSNMIGQFGWVDTNLPTWLVMIIAAMIASLVLLGLVLGTRGERLVILVLAVQTIVVPVVIHASQAKYIGIVWQGRYFLPAAVGLPVLAGFACTRALGEQPRLFVRRAAVLLGTTGAFSQVVAFTINLHRYQKGGPKGWLAVPRDQWNQPLPMSMLVVLLLIGLAGTVRLVVRGHQLSDADADGPPDHGDRAIAAPVRA